MSRWSTRLRRAASLLLGVHLLQVILLAASAVCDPRATSGTGNGHHVVGAAVAAEHATPVAPMTHVHHASSTAVPNDGPAEHTGHHSPVQGAACPMAMACTVTAVVAPVPAIVTSEIRVATLRVMHVATAPLSTRLAPEPPPPRA